MRDAQKRIHTGKDADRVRCELRRMASWTPEAQKEFFENSDPKDRELLETLYARLHTALGLEEDEDRFTGTAQANPAFRADLNQVLGNIGRSLDALLGG
jgi:hypothetical protein